MSAKNSELLSLSCHRLTIYWMHDVRTSFEQKLATVGSTLNTCEREKHYRYDLIFKYIQLWPKSLLDRRSRFRQFSLVVETLFRSVVNKILRSSEVHRFVEIVPPWDGAELPNSVELLGIQHRNSYPSPHPHWGVRSIDINALSLCSLMSLMRQTNFDQKTLSAVVWRLIDSSYHLQSILQHNLISSLINRKESRGNRSFCSFCSFFDRATLSVRIPSRFDG